MLVVNLRMTTVARDIGKRNAGDPEGPPAFKLSLFCDAQIFAQMFVVGIVTPTLDLVGYEPEIGIVH